MKIQSWVSITALLLTISLLFSSCASSESLLDTAIPPSPTLTFVDETPTSITPNNILTNTPTIIASDIPVPPTTPPLTECIELLTNGSWYLEGEASGDAQPPEPFQPISKNALDGKNILQIKINLNGGVFGEGARKDEAAIIIDQEDENGRWTVASVVTHNIENGKDVEQIIFIPLNDFEALTWDGTGVRGKLDLNLDYGPIHARFWNKSDFKVDIKSIMACNSQ